MGSASPSSPSPARHWATRLPLLIGPSRCGSPPTMRAGRTDQSSTQRSSAIPISAAAGRSDSMSAAIRSVSKPSSQLQAASCACGSRSPAASSFQNSAMPNPTDDTHSRPGLPRADYKPGARGPLSGLRVIDLSRLVAGNLLTQHLADFGADVIKVEPREGDTLRGWRINNVETTWKVHSRNKRSLCVEFRHDEAVPLIRKLIPGAAMLIESFRPGTLEQMGLAPDELLRLEPRLGIVRISGWGQTGPYHRRPGFGTLVEVFSGFAEMNGFPDREPVLPPMYLADALSGLTGAFAAMAALREVEINGGRGQVVDLPLLEPIVNSLGPQAANYRLTGKVKPRSGSRSSGSVPRNVYRTLDGGWVCLSASTQGMAMRVLRSIGRPDLCDDPRFKTNEQRLVHVVELDQTIGDFIGARTM